MPIFIGLLLGVAFIIGGLAGEAYQKDQIGNACLTKKEIEIRGHIFKCERTKIKEGL